MTRRVGRRLVLCAGILAAVPATVFAQAPVPAERWEVAVHLGGLAPTNLRGGVSTVPAAGGPLAIAGRGAGARVPSWLFGDGVELLNAVSGMFGRSSRATPLEAALAQPLTHEKPRVNVGGRIGRVLTPRLTVELSMDYSPDRTEIRESVSEGLRQALVSSATTMRDVVFAASGYPAEQVAEVTFRAGQGGHVLTTGTVKVGFGPIGRVRPFASGGAGVASRFGKVPRAVLEHRYYFRSGHFFPFEFEEVDLVTVRAAPASHMFVAVVGGGLDIQPGLELWRGAARNTSRWGIRVEGRVFLSGAATETQLDAHPSVVTTAERYGPNDGLSANVFVTGDAAAIQFSNDPSLTGFESTLGGAPMNGSGVFRDRGTRVRVVVTSGLFVRF
jgi:hypothetical protein